jgi:nucleotide-binding universal stress UspA family protein
VGRAVGQAQLTAPAVEAVTALEYPELPGPLPADFHPQELARRVLDPAIEEAAGATPVEGAPGRDREASRSGLAGASKDASLLVVGSRGHGEFAGVLTGPVRSACIASPTRTAQW